MTVAEWNELYPIGTPVKRWALMNPWREPLEDTKTRSTAWDLCGTPVVMVSGQPGGVALDALTPIVVTE